MKRERAAYSMVEMLVVLLVAGILASIAVPNMRTIIATAQLNSAVSDLFGAIGLARSQAIARGSRVQLVPLEPGGARWREGWVVFVDADGDRRPSPGEEIIASHGPLPAGMEVSFNFTSNRAPLYVAFNGNGRSCSDTSSLAARWGTFSLYQARQIRRIRINMLGRARVCNPSRDGSSCAGDAEGA